LAGKKKGSGVSVTIDSVRRCKEHIEVYSHEENPLTNTDEVCYPAYIVAIKKTRLPVVFEDMKIIYPEDSIYGEWFFQYYENLITGEKESVLPAGGPVTLELSSEYLFTGKIIVNQINGRFELKENHEISFSDISITYVGSEKSIIDWERRYFNALSNVRTFDFSRTELKLYFDSNQKAMVYKKRFHD